MHQCSKKSVLRCMNCKHTDCDIYIITQIFIKLGILNSEGDLL